VTLTTWPVKDKASANGRLERAGFPAENRIEHDRRLVAQSCFFLKTRARDYEGFDTSVA
jgi:hypothetical protein